jgi:hypothetical protein
VAGANYQPGNCVAIEVYIMPGAHMGQTLEGRRVGRVLGVTGEESCIVYISYVSHVISNDDGILALKSPSHHLMQSVWVRVLREGE